MSQKEMRKQTERKYRKCLEVKNKKKEIKRKEEYKINKIMANVFNKVILHCLFLHKLHTKYQKPTSLFTETSKENIKRKC